MLVCGAMVAEVGGYWYFDIIPSPNTTVFGVLWPPSIALWGSLVPPCTILVRYRAVTSALIEVGYRKCIYVFSRFEASYTWYVGWYRLELACTVC